MNLKRTSAVLLTVAVAGFGLTACTEDDKAVATPPATTAAAAPTSAAPTAAAPSSAAPSSAAPAATTPAANAPKPSVPGAPSLPGGIVSGSTTKPSDLPADLPLPEGKLTSVTGVPNAYVMTYAVADGKAAANAYSKALAGAGFDVAAVEETGGAADKGDINVLYSAKGNVLTLTYAKG